jgi:hypothetical protein
MIKFNEQKSKKNLVFKTNYTPEKLEKFKSEGVLLKINNTAVKLKERKEIFKKSFKKPRLAVFNIDDHKIGLSVFFADSANFAYVDIKEINRFSSNWNNVDFLDNIKPGKEETIEINRSKGQSIKIRVTCIRDNDISFEDIIYEDPNFKFYNDPPELIVVKKDVISLRLFNLNRFLNGGYFRIFKKENQETEKCIYIGQIGDTTVYYSDKNVNNYDHYVYRAEIYDNLGNLYSVLPKKVFYEKSNNIKRLNVDYDSDENVYRFTKIGNEKFVIQIHNIETESTDFLEYSEKNDTVFFSVNDYSNFIIHIEGYENNVLTCYEEILRNNKRKISIINERIQTNSKNQNIIKWNYEGNIDTFIVTMKNKLRQKIVETLSHRQSKEGYIYCIDDNYEKERIYTEYYINAVDEFGNIIDKKRLVK